MTSCSQLPADVYRRKIARPVEFKSYKKLPISKQFTNKINNEKSNKSNTTPAANNNEL